MQTMCGFLFYQAMKEEIVEKNGEKVIEVRSDGGKLLFVKTKKGYEIKCPRTKEICLIRYEIMFTDCLRCLEDMPDEISSHVPQLSKGIKTEHINEIR